MHSLIWRFTFLLLFITSTVMAVCQTHLLSLSNADICENGICHYQDVIQAKVPAIENSQFCLSLGIKDDQDLKMDFVITIIDSWVRYPLSDCFTTDDPDFHFTAFCGCPGGTTSTCSYCPVSAPPNTSSVCMEGHTQSSGCLLSGYGAYCGHVWADGGNRYKVCSLGNPTLDISFNVSLDNKVSQFTINTAGISTVQSSSYNMTFYPSKLHDISSKYELLFDVYNADIFYFVPTKLMNSFDTKDPSKLGWYRYNETLPSALGRISNIYTLDCKNNDFRFSSGARNVELWMQSNSDLSAGVLFPGALLIDPMSTIIQVPDVADSPNLAALGEGSYFYTASGDIKPIGIYPDGSFPYEKTTSKTLTSWLNTCGTQTNIAVLCTDWFNMFWDEGILYSIRECYDPSLPSCWGIGIQLYNSSDKTQLEYYDTGVFPAIKWPTLVQGFWQIIPPNFALSFLQNLTMITTSTAVVIPGSEEILDMVLTLDDIPIQFKSSSITPHIDRIRSDDKDIKVWAKSIGHGGECLMISNDDLFKTQEVVLTENEKLYEFRSSVKQFEGMTSITLQCYKNKDVVKFEVQIHDKNPDVEEETIVNSNVRMASIDWTWWDYVKYGLKYPFIKAAGAFEVVKKFVLWTILIYLAWALLGCIIVGILFLFYRWYKSRNTMNTKPIPALPTVPPKQKYL